MVPCRRVPVSFLLASLIVPAARARAEAPMCTPDSPDVPRAPALALDAAAPRPPGPSKIEWRDVFWGDRYGGVRHAARPFRDGRLLEGQALYLALDRPDLAAAYRKRQETKTSLGIATGIFLATTAVAAVIANAEVKAGRPAPVGALIGLGLGITLTGTFAIANATTPGDVVDDGELHRLVDAHNRSP